MKTAVIYARYSSENQTEQSIEGQLRICQEYAKTHDILILDTYIDRAMTGTNDNRPDFQRMIKDSQKKEWDYVIVYKLDRFSRNKYEMAMHKKTLKDNGTKLLSAMEYIPDSPEAIIIESMLEGYAEYYSAELSQKVKRGMRETRLKGNFTGGQIIYGYRVENHKVVIDESQAEVIRYIYKQYSLGVYVKDIIDTLTQNNVLNKGKPFARNTIYNILKNQKYFGIYQYGNEIFDNIYPQIVSNDIYEKVRQKIALNKYGKRSVAVDYLLRHKLKCGYCGMPISAECGTASNGTKKHYYKCLGRKRKNGCLKSMVRKDILEDFVISTIINELSKQENQDIIVNNLYNIQNQRENNSLLLSLQKEKRQLQNRLDNILKAIENGIINNTTNKRMKELEERIDVLEKQILIEKSKINNKYSKEEILKYYEQALKLEPKLLINYLVKEITLFDDKIIIQFNSPIKQSPLNQGFCFYKSIKKMRKIIQNKPLPTFIDMETELYI